MLTAGPSLAQHQPYAGLQERPVEALSKQQVADLMAGRGMGLALAAELNGCRAVPQIDAASTRSSKRWTKI
jgi:hypothetical protein